MAIKESNSHAAPSAPAQTTQPPSFWEARLAPFLEKHFLVLCISLIAVACARVISTYNALSLTSDEPYHFAIGLEYVAKHIYHLGTEQPPLSHMMQALGPYLAGARPLGKPTPNLEGFSVIAGSGNVDRTIFLMRLGNLPFFLLACLVVCAWSCHSFGRPIAVVATGLFTLLPTMLADAGLATTDMALGANVGAVFFAMLLWAERPTWWRSVLLGLFAALACLSKFTALGYIPMVAFLALTCYLLPSWPGWLRLSKLAKERMVPLAFAAGTMALLMWAAYWFSVGPSRLPYIHLYLSVPAPELFDGIRTAVGHNQGGHPAFLLGEFRFQGWWYYFPVALAVKTPIAILILLAFGTYVCLRERCLVYRMPLAFIVGILLPAMWSRIDIGIRHVEPIYLGISIVSALGLRQVMQWARTGVASALTAGALVMWIVISVALHHPDYLAYFNEFAGPKPERILVDSNYDWGQDLKLLGTRLRQLGVGEFSLASLNEVGMMSIPERFDYLETWYGLPAIREFDTCRPLPGWNVVSTTIEKSISFVPELRFYRGSKMSKPWYEQVTPNERVGPLLLYNIPIGSKLKSENCN